MALSASAYVDPTTTALITQIVAGIVISLGVTFGIFRQKILIFFRNIKVKALKKKIEKENKNER